MCQYWDKRLNLLSSILTILLTCPNNDTLLCYSNDPFLTVCIETNGLFQSGPWEVPFISLTVPQGRHSLEQKLI